MAKALKDEYLRCISGNWNERILFINESDLSRAGNRSDILSAVSCVVAEEDVSGQIRRFQEMFEGV